ncbi:MAG: ferritin-like domain-containing protein [Burkholderiaceae bacterium]
MSKVFPTASSLRPRALAILGVSDVADKCRLTTELAQTAAAGGVNLDTIEALQCPSTGVFPGRPARPELIDPGLVPTRSPFTVEGRAALLHAICHIEFNAVNLALDAVWRFPGMPEAFYFDWLRVAGEEAYHFGLLHDLLQQLRGPKNEQWSYGSFAAHDGMWAMCEKTASDITARMALVPRTLEARGLDATPLIQAKLRKVGTPDAQAICDALDIILRDEIGHVAVGNRWYGWLCQQQGLEPVAHYRLLAKRHDAPRLRPPFNDEARRQAGFSEVELAYLLTES